MATTIQELFDGDTFQFLKQGTVIFGDISDLLDQQFNRLSLLEKQVMIWLAIHREWMSLSELEQEIIPVVTRRSLMEAVESLQLRSLIEKASANSSENRSTSFTQQPVVMEYVTNHLVEQVYEEILQAEIGLFNRHALIQAQAKDYLRQIQLRLILKPLADRLLLGLGGKLGVYHQLQEILAVLRSAQSATAKQPQPPQKPGYAAGNLLNLVGQLELKACDFDFSNLAVWQAYLRGIDLQSVNFSGADLSRSVFTQTLGILLSAAFSPDGTLLATGIDSEICIWQVNECRQLLTYKGHKAWVQAITFSPDGKMLSSGSQDHTIRVWDVETGQCLKTLRGHTSGVQAVIFRGCYALFVKLGA